MKSFEKKYLDNLPVSHNLVKIIRQIGEYKGKQELYQVQIPEVLENLRKVAIVQSVESSNKIEGITADPKKIKRIVEEKVIPSNRNEGEIAGYRDVLNTIHNNFQDIPFTPEIVLQFHRDLMKYTTNEGDRWKSVQNEIVEVLPDGRKRRRFLPIKPLEVPTFMKELHERYNEMSKKLEIDPLIMIPLYVLDFLCIHPFLDGNGRISRLLSVLLLHKSGYEVVRYISLERIIEKTKDLYYKSLYESSQGWHVGKHNAIPWIEYTLSTLLASYHEFENRVGKISSSRGSKTRMVMEAIDTFVGNFSISDIEMACPAVSRDMIRYVLTKLKNEGRIRPIGKGRYAKWHKIQ